MKLATYKDGTRDGQLLVVSRDLTTAHYASGIASHLQQVLDDWNFLSPQLQDLSQALNQGRARHAFPFDPKQCMAPLPRAFQLVVGSETDDAQQAPSDDFLGPCDAVPCPSGADGIDFQARVAVITGDIPLACSSDRALEGIRLLLLSHTLHLRQRLVASAFSPVAVTPDALGDAWGQGQLHLSLQTSWNGRKVGTCDTGQNKKSHLGQLMAGIAQHRRLRAGSIIATGPASTQSVSAQGDTLRIEAKDKLGLSVFGALDQEMVLLEK